MHWSGLAEIVVLARLERADLIVVTFLADGVASIFAIVECVGFEFVCVDWDEGVEYRQYVQLICASET